VRPKREEVACHSVDRKVESNAASRGPSLRISSIRRLRHMNLAYPPGGRPLGRLQRLLCGRKEGSHPMHRVTEE
jgi:hypothetical protein